MGMNDSNDVDLAREVGFWLPFCLGVAWLLIQVPVHAHMSDPFFDFFCVF
jgi:hypothetical protein